MINLNLKIRSQWKKFTKKNITLYIKGYVYSHSIDEIINKFSVIKKFEVNSFVKSLDGHFAIIVNRKDLTLLIVDKIRSTPIFFTKIKNEFYIDYDPKNLVKLKDFNNKINENGKLEIAMSGFTIGNKTLFENLYSLKAGETVLFENGTYERSQYYKYFSKLNNKGFNEYIEELSEVTLKIFKKMIKQIDGRQIVIPLSAGNDSRLVASVLKHLGVNNVKCYSYGTNGNFEAKTAKIICQRLGYEWKFIPLTHKGEKNFYFSEDYKNYLNYSETYCSAPYIQSLSTIKYLKDMNWIDNQAVFINGNSGDFISGGHIKEKIYEARKIENNKFRKENIITELIEKHFSLWSDLKTKNNLYKIKKNLWYEIKKSCGDIQEYSNDHQFYEYSEMIDRQSKYVVTGQKVFEYYKHEWRLPLWDDEYLFFWEKVPLEFKFKQKLFTTMIKKKNFGNVWGNDIPINKKTITPKWIIPLRFISKIPFSFFGEKGKRAWKQFDINVFFYFRDVNHMMDTQNYFMIVKDIFKGPKNHLSWQTQDYLKKKLSEKI